MVILAEAVLLPGVVAVFAVAPPLLWLPPQPSTHLSSNHHQSHRSCVTLCIIK